MASSSSLTESRSKSGCLECRRKKKRCDEAKPVCSLCARRSVPCNYPGLEHEALKFFTSVASEHLLLPIESSISEGTFIHLHRDEFSLVCPQYNILTTGTDFESSQAFDETWSSQLSLSSQQRLLWSSHPDWKPCLEQGIENTLVQYYLDVISASRVYIPTESNLFVSLVAPVVFHSHGPLLSTVLAMSAAEWGLRTSSDHVNYAFAAASYKAQALQQLQRRLESPGCAEENLLTCVLQASLEIAEGSRPTWLKHFRGALAILDVYGEHISPASAAAVLHYFQFRYTLMKTTQANHFARLHHSNNPQAHMNTREAADLEYEDLLEAASNSLRLATPDPSGVDARQGCSVEMLDLIHAISGLSANVDEMPPAEVYSKGIALERRISNLSFAVEADLDDYLQNSAECFRVASHIYLQVAVHSTPVFNKKVLDFHKSLLLRLSAVIFEGQPRRSFPMWPLFIAGCASSSDEQRKAILELFSILDSKWPVSNISTVLRVIWTVWQSRDLSSTTKANQHPDWQDTIQKFGWKLALS